MGVNLRELLIRWQFWALEGQAVLLLAASIVELPRLIRALPRKAATMTIVVAVACLTWALTAHLAPRTSRILFDEQIYQGIGQNLADLHRAQMCNDGTVEYGRLQCWRAEYNKEPNGFPYLLSIPFRVFGVSGASAFQLNNAAAAAAAATTVLLAMLLFEDLPAAALAGLVFALIPLQLTWSNTAAAEPTAALMVEFAMLTAVWWIRAQTASALLWLIAAAAFATTFRPESLLVLPLIVTAIVLLRPRSLLRVPMWMAAAAAVALAAPTTWLHLWAVRSENWGSGGVRFSTSFIRLNLPVNLGFYVSGDRFPLLFTLLAIAGLAAAGRRREKLLLAIYFLFFWGVFLVFYAGSYDYGADVRYSLLSYAPLALLAGAGARLLAAFASRWTGGPGLARPLTAVVVVIVLQFLWYAPLVRATGEEAWAARADVVFAQEFARAMPANSIVLTQTPSMFHVWGVNAAQMSIATTDRPYVDQHLFARYSG